MRPKLVGKYMVTYTVKNDNGIIVVEVESYDYKTGKVKFSVRNSASRHINISLRFMGNYSSLGRATTVAEKNDIYKPGKTTETIIVNVLYDIKLVNQNSQHILKTFVYRDLIVGHLCATLLKVKK